MSYLSVLSFIESGEKSLKDKNYWSALSVALSLPSMCSRLQYQGDEYKGNNKQSGYWHLRDNGTKDWHDRKCYKDFCKLIMRVDSVDKTGHIEKGIPDTYLKSLLGDKFAEVLYELRCDILHAGIVNINSDNKGIYLLLGDLSSAYELLKYRVIPIVDLCENIFGHTKTWCSNYGMSNFKYTYVFDTENNRDDKLLLNKLCDNDRADYLLQQFEKENSEKN